MITRRRLLVTSVCAFCAGPSYGESKHRLTCVLYDKDPQDGDGGLSGLGKLDLNANYAIGLGVILADLTAELEIKPTFVMYDDEAKNPNALSSQTALSPETLGLLTSDQQLPRRVPTSTDIYFSLRPYILIFGGCQTEKYGRSYTQILYPDTTVRIARE